MKTKLFYGCLLLILSSVHSVFPQQNCNVPTNLYNGLLAFYPFSGGSLNDFSGNNRHLTNPTGAVSATDRFGSTDCAYSFANFPTFNDDYLTFTNPTFLDGLSAFSVSVWYKAEDPNRDPGVFESVVSRDTGLSCPDRNGQWSIGLYDCRIAVFGRENSVWENYTFTNCVPDNTGMWKHAVATYDLTTDTMKFYINGNLEGMEVGPANCGFTPVSLDIGDLFIGKYFNGLIDDVYIYDRELTANEVVQLYQLTNSCCTNILDLASVEIPANEILIYPNPAKHQLQIATPTNGMRIQLFTVTGTLVKQIENYNSMTTISVSDLPNGVYMIITEKENYKSVAKLVVQK